MDPRDAKTAAPREPVAEPAALPWGMDKTDVQKSSFTELTDEKLARFVIGQQKKTKYEKEREEREVRKRKADAEAAAMYAKFVASFDDEDETLGKAFVRSGSSVSGESDLYRLQGAGTKKKKTISDMDRLVDEMKHNQTAPPQNKRREMDLLVEEIKSREASAPTVEEIAPLKTGSFDTGDPATTNLYVGNLAPSVTEEKLEQIFSKFGRIYSIKIMWPRSEEERSRRRMCGFVSFFTRRAAEEARTHVNDSELDGQRIVVGWSKAVKIEPGAAVFSSGGSGVQPLSVPCAVLTIPSDQPKIVVQIPSDQTMRRRIDHLAAYVAKDGLAFEHAVRLREAQNPLYGFLFNTCASPAPMPDAVYYRWRVFAFAMGDTETTWRQTPFQMTMQGPVWIPPPLPSTNTRLPSTRDADGLRHDRKQRKSSRSRSHSRSRSDSRDRRSRRSHSASRSPSRRGQSRSSRSSRRSHSRSKSRSRRRRSYSRSPSRSSRSNSDRSDRSDRSNHSDRCRRSRSSSRSRGHGRSRPRSRSPRRDDDGHRQSRRRSRSRGSSRSRSPLARRSHNRSDDLHVVKKDESVLTGQQLARARDLERGREPNRLPRDAYDRFVELLHTLTLEREAIKQAMGCALDNSECAVELVHILRKRFSQEDASAVQLVAYLYVASDILHNSSAAVKNASLFRTTFQACLPEILDRLRQVHRTLQGRMSALAMRDKVLAVLTAWGSWSLFPPQYLVGLNATFLRKVDEPAGMEEGNASYGVDEEKLRKACSHAGILSSGSVGAMLARLQWLKEFTSPTTKSAAPKAKEMMPVKERKSEEQAIAKKEVEGEDDLDGEPMDDRALGDDDLDGEPLEEDVDGEPLDPEREILDEDVNGEPLIPEIGDVDEEDLDGEPLDDEDDVDGEPLDEDLDGEPL